MNLEKIADQEKRFVNATGKWDFDCERAYQIQIGKLDLIGTYDSNNGVIAFVDENRCLWVGRWSKESEQVLKDAGYTRKSLYVPYSNNFGLNKAFENYRRK